MGLNGNKFPWYRERLRNKYSKDVNPILNHKNWTFVKNGLDDFRDGMPPDPGHGKLILRPLVQFLNSHLWRNLMRVFEIGSCDQNAGRSLLF